MSGADDDAILAAMLEQAERLCQGSDALLSGQYRYLCERIRALIELRAALQPSVREPT